MATEQAGLPRRVTLSDLPPGSARAVVQQMQGDLDAVYDVLARRINEIVLSGTLANRPTAGIKDRIYYATDEPAGGNVFWDDGTTWQRLGVRQRTGTATWDPASVAAGAQVTTTVTVTGAAIGDAVAAGFSQDLQGLQLTGYVSATNTVTVVLQNGTAGAVDLASGTLRAVTWSY